MSTEGGRLAVEVCAELSGRASCFSQTGKLGKLGNSQGCWGGELGPEEGRGWSGEGKPVVQESRAAGMVQWSENEEAGRSWGMLSVVSGGGGVRKGPFAARRLGWFYPHVPVEGTQHQTAVTRRWHQSEWSQGQLRARGPCIALARSREDHSLTSAGGDSGRGLGKRGCCVDPELWASRHVQKWDVGSVPLH